MEVMKKNCPLSDRELRSTMIVILGGLIDILDLISTPQPMINRIKDVYKPPLASKRDELIKNGQ